MVEGLYPKTVKEALIAREQYDDTVLVSGGTDLGVVKKYAPYLIFLNQIEELKQVWEYQDNLYIGAEVTYVSLIEQNNMPVIPTILVQAIKKIASPAIRNVGTITGNICNASPAGDTLPVLYAMNANVIVASIHGEEIETKKVPVNDFIRGIRKIALTKEEIVTAIEIPSYKRVLKMNYAYQKVGAREAEAISKASFAAIWEICENTITDFRICFGSVGMTVLRKEELEHYLFGLTREQVHEKAAELVEKYKEIIHPIDDQRSTAEYRKNVCLNLLQDCLENC